MSFITAVKIHNTNKKGTRYGVEFKHEHILEQQVMQGQELVEQFLREHQELDAMGQTQ